MTAPPEAGSQPHVVGAASTRVQLPWLAAGVAVLNWVAVASSWEVIQDVTKPAVIVALLWWFWARTGDHPGLQRRVIAVGVAASLAGDVALIGSDSIDFEAGLVFFLAAHLSYITGLSVPVVRPRWWSLVAAAALLGYGVWLYSKLSPHVSGVMTVAAPVYAVALCLMTWSALRTVERKDWSRVAAGLVAIGGVSFLASDSTLAWEHFVGDGGRELAIMVTYHLGQFGITAGVVNRWLQR